MAQSASARQQGIGNRAQAACLPIAALDTPAASHDDETWPQRRGSACIWRIPLLAGVVALYLSCAGWATDAPPSTIDLVVTLTAETLDPLLLWDLLWDSPEI